MEKETEKAKPTFKELLLSDLDRFDLEMPARGSNSRQQVDEVNMFGELQAEN